MPNDTRHQPPSQDEAGTLPAEGARHSRYLVVDTGDPNGEMVLPSGKRGRVLGTFRSADLAFALAEAERREGHRVLIFDSEKLQRLIEGTRR